MLTPLPPPPKWINGLESTLGAIGKERVRQHQLWGVQVHPLVVEGKDALWLAHHYSVPTAAEAKAVCDQTTESGSVTWYDIALEELQEFMEAAALGDVAAAKVEITQLGAVCAQIMQAIDTGTVPPMVPGNDPQTDGAVAL